VNSNTCVSLIFISGWQPRQVMTNITNITNKMTNITTWQQQEKIWKRTRIRKTDHKITKKNITNYLEKNGITQKYRRIQRWMTTYNKTKNMLQLSGSTKYCQKKHHSHLHFEKPSNYSSKSSPTGPQSEAKASTSAHA
jgi:predicted nucleotide-binding protein (sugar kinase/HSP70/actin superfamily)